MANESGDKAHAHTNRLVNETSPYLLQHAHNPVDWYPWGEEALSKAKAENKPILLSVGYSACHWCHVMERESFENPAIADLMNRYFVSIKVDREERPDIDAIYMEAVQAFSGQGGWPMTVFLTPDGAPFYGGTYYPPDNRHPNIPSFPQLLEAINETWHTRPEDVQHNANAMRQALQGNRTLRQVGGEDEISADMIDQALVTLVAQFDPRNGGLGRAPKFPQAMALDFVLRASVRTGNQQALRLLMLTLDKMANGGMYDQLGGGFHRYSVDSVWLVPHFEKMLYDNAQLAILYLEAWKVSGKDFYRAVCVDILEYVLREMTSPEGGFYSAQDADSEGEEGKFFVWSKAEIEQVLGAEDAHLFNLYYGVTEKGNFEGHNILNVPDNVENVMTKAGVSVEELETVLERCRSKLFAVREKRVHPGLDDKILTAWNGLMMKAFAVAGRVLEEPKYTEAARRNGEFVLANLERDGRLLRTYKNTAQGGVARLNGYLEDYSYYIDALLSLYEATFDLKWLNEADRLAQVMVAKFWDDKQQGFFDTASDHEELVTRPRNVFDNAVPSGNSVAVDVLLKLSVLTDTPDNNYRTVAVTSLQSLSDVATQHPTAFGRFLAAMDFYVSRPKEIVIIGDEDAEATRELLRAVYSQYLPNKVVMLATPQTDSANMEAWPLLRGKTQLNNQPTAFVCENYACQYPVNQPKGLLAQLS